MYVSTFVRFVHPSAAERSAEVGLDGGSCRSKGTTSAGSNSSSVIPMLGSRMTLVGRMMRRRGTARTDRRVGWLRCSDLNMVFWSDLF